ncbi:MAG: hypothetical protein IIC78_01080 [Chloroflexi bacterium]|nr:hypothetical protein [Chloroflexota bacterium]
MVSLVRVRWNDQAIIKQVLDWGAEGVMIPMIVSASEARRAVAACRYPPKGVRGFSPREASNYFHDLDEYMATANQRMIALIQVEQIIDQVSHPLGIHALLRFEWCRNGRDNAFKALNFKHGDSLHLSIGKSNCGAFSIGCITRS